MTPDLIEKLTVRLKRDNFDPDYLPELDYMPSTRKNISLKISINSKTMLNIAKRIFKEFDAMIEDGPIDIEPGFKIKFRQHVSKVWKETLVLLVEGIAASHAVVGVFMLHNNLTLEEIHLPNLEIFLIGSIAAAIYFLHSYTKYQKIVED